MLISRPSASRSIVTGGSSAAPKVRTRPDAS
jgi:hypothetical protein